MVSFSCDGCAEILKKNQVDSHAKRCRSCVSVSCVDCSVSFPEDEYKKHTSCLTEAERYEKSVYKGPRKNDTTPSNLKRTPQEIWMETLQKTLTLLKTLSSSSSCSPHMKVLQNYLQQLLTMENVPRKEKPFYNFAFNSFKIQRNSQEGNEMIQTLWKYIRQVQEEGKREFQSVHQKDTNLHTNHTLNREEERSSSVSASSVSIDPPTHPRTTKDVHTHLSHTENSPRNRTPSKKQVQKVLERLLFKIFTKKRTKRSNATTTLVDTPQELPSKVSMKLKHLEKKVRTKFIRKKRILMEDLNQYDIQNMILECKNVQVEDSNVVYTFS